jgi:hypothetical protein
MKAKGEKLGSLKALLSSALPPGSLAFDPQEPVAD